MGEYNKFAAKLTEFAFERKEGGNQLQKLSVSGWYLSMRALTYKHARVRIVLGRECNQSKHSTNPKHSFRAKKNENNCGEKVTAVTFATAMVERETGEGERVPWGRVVPHSL